MTTALLQSQIAIAASTPPQIAAVHHLVRCMVEDLPLLALTLRTLAPTRCSLPALPPHDTPWSVSTS